MCVGGGEGGTVTTTPQDNIHMLGTLNWFWYNLRGKSGSFLDACMQHAFHSKILYIHNWNKCWGKVECSGGLSPGRKLVDWTLMSAVKPTQFGHLYTHYYFKNLCDSHSTISTPRLLFILAHLNSCKYTPSKRSFLCSLCFTDTWHLWLILPDFDEHSLLSASTCSYSSTSELASEISASTIIASLLSCHFPVPTGW